MDAAWPLTGRSAQLDQLQRLYRAAGTGGVVLHGPAGVGKTRLAEEALSQVERTGNPVGRVVGHPATRAIPLGALAHLLPGNLVHDLGVGDDERTALFHAARAALGRVSGEGRLALLVDDLDLLDDTSMAVLVPLVVSRRLFLLGTIRTGAPSPRLTGLQRDGHLVRLEIAPLGRHDLSQLLERALGRPASSRALTELARLSGGNLQVLHELVRGARDRGALVRRGERWELQGPLRTTAALEELVAEHLAGVDEAGRAVLEVLAVCERFGLQDLERLHGAATLEGLEANGLVQVVTEGRRTALRLAHPLYGEVLRAQLPPLRLRRIQQELAGIVEAHGARRREDVVRVALWRVASGGGVSADHLARAARLSLAGRDAELAIRFIDAVPDDCISAGERALMLAEAHAMLGHDDEVEAVVAGVWDAPLTDAHRSQLSRRLADTRFFGRRDLAGALDAHARALEHVTDPEEIAAVGARRALLLAGSGQPAAALEITDAIATATTGRARVELAAARATALINLGRCDEAADISRRAASDHAGLPDWLARRGIAIHLVNEAHALAYSGRYDQARQLLQPAAERARATNAIGALVWFEMAQAEIARDTGRAHEAIRLFQAVADAAPGSGQDAALIWAHVGVAQGHLLLGESEPAAAALRRADAVGDSPIATSHTTRERTRAWLAACRGDLEAARATVREVAATSRRDQSFLFESGVVHDLVRLGAAREAAARLEELATMVDGPLVQAHARHARAAAARDTTELAAVVDAYEAIDALGMAAEVAAELAGLLRAASEARRATAAQQRSAELAARAGGLRTPMLAQGSGVEPLTAREREVALLAAAGRSSKEIADRLDLSTRTVDTHLGRVYRKLGITRRRELGPALGVRPGG
jgi:ATP/maltotriose-dependent transcriptional regulator MalT